MTKILFLFYQLVLIFFGFLYTALRLAQGRRVQGIGERLGRYAPEVKEALAGMDRPIWIHLVSVGEALAAGPVITALRRIFPNKPWVVTTTTPTGREVARRWIREGQDQLLYLPWDLSFAVGRALERIGPSLFLVFETELWPVLFHQLGRRQVPIAILNGRISPSAYRRYLWIRPFMERILEPVHVFLTQSPQDAKRYAAIGAAKDRIVSVGNMKWDLDLPAVSEPQALESLKRQLKPSNGSSVLWTAGSTHPGEERLLLEVYKRLKSSYPGLLLLLAPRHPERISQVEQEVAQAGLSFMRRTKLREKPEGAVILLDTLGELTRIYEMSDVVFVGGSLVPHGGHNLVEPALFGRAILTGRHLQNFQAVSEALHQAGGIAIVKTEQELEARMRQLLEKPALRQEVGERAFDVIRHHRGATQRTVDLLAGRWRKQLS